MKAAYALINQDAIRHNIQKVREFAPNSKIMAVIKANAYGHGLLTISQALNQIDAVAVARLDEGKSLRKSGFSHRITILEGFVSQQELIDLAQNNLDVVVHSIEQVRIVEKYQGPEKLSVWLKINSGMNRLGINPLEFASIYKCLKACTHVVQPISLMTHLSSADSDENSVSIQQINRFKNLVDSYPGEKSIANSAALMTYQEALTDWVRPGIMIYGVSPFFEKDGIDFGLKPVMSLYSQLISVKKIAKGESVGYSGTWVSNADTQIGVVAIGYGDGYSRYTRSGAPVLVNGKRVSLIGRVSMDMITVDLGLQSKAKIGDKVTLWGDGLSVEEIARYSNTIPYTLLCGITQRVKMNKV